MVLLISFLDILAYKKNQSKDKNKTHEPILRMRSWPFILGLGFSVLGAFKRQRAANKKVEGGQKEKAGQMAQEGRLWREKKGSGQQRKKKQRKVGAAHKMKAGGENEKKIGKEERKRGG